jgi:hypothetical protein
MTRLPGTLIVVVLLAILTGCASAADAADSPAEPVAPSPSAEPSASIPARPTVALGGSCETFLDETTLSALLGDAVVLQDETLQSERVWAVDVLGGLDCAWSGAGDASVAVDVVPAQGMETEIAAAGSDSPNCYGAGRAELRCSFSTTVAGYWVSAIVGVPADSPSTAPQVFDAIVDRVAAEADSAEPVAAVRPDGTWSAPVDCAALGAAIDTTRILGESYSAADGSRGGEVPAGLSSAWVLVGDLPCVWSSADQSGWFASELLPGAGWAITELSAREGARAAAVEGALAAVALPAGDATSVYASDGANLAWVTVPAGVDPVAADGLASALLAAASG